MKMKYIARQLNCRLQTSQISEIPYFTEKLGMPHMNREFITDIPSPSLLAHH